jgi:hypothetical protein
MTWIDDAQFAARFRTRAVTAQRLQDTLDGLAATPLQFGPVRLGPIELAINGSLGTAEITPTPSGSFDVAVSASAALTVWVGTRIRLACDLVIRLNVRPRYADPLLIVIDMAPICADDVTIRTQASGLVAMIPGLVDTVLAEARGIIADQIDALLDTERLRSSRVICIGARLEPDGTAAVVSLPTEWRWLSDVLPPVSRRLPDQV